MQVPESEYQRRLNVTQERMSATGIDLLLVTPGEDLQYLVGYQAVPLERLTCLAIPQQATPYLVAPNLEIAAAKASPVGELGLTIRGWAEHEDPTELLAAELSTASAVGVVETMWAERLLALQSQYSHLDWQLSGPVIHAVRAVKSQPEIDALVEAAAAVDHVHSQVPGFLAVGRTEREVAHDIHQALTAAGHSQVDFIIVGSGANSASPHHEVSDKVIERGDPVVVDIGGTMPSGYCSDMTRTYSLGQPPQEFLEFYEVLRHAQAAALAAVRPGMSGRELDAVARDLIADAGWGEYFIHRTGHGIGLGTHEDPYIVSTNEAPLQSGNAFSIEPGIYLQNKYGARIEDIVVCEPQGAEVLNHASRDLVIV